MSMEWEFGAQSPYGSAPDYGYPDWASRHQNYQPGSYNPPVQKEMDWDALIKGATESMEGLQRKMAPRMMQPGNIFPMPTYAQPAQIPQQAPQSMDGFMNFMKFMQLMGPMLYGGQQTQRF